MIRTFIGTVAITSVSFAQYAPVELPREWTFKTATTAYSTEDPNVKLGQFQPGIKVSVVGKDAQSGRWRVVFERHGQPDIKSWIDTPNLAESNPEAFARIEQDLAEFPLLKKLLEKPEPWPEKATDLATWLFPGDGRFALASGNETSPSQLVSRHPKTDAIAWGMAPLSASVDYRQPDNPQVTIEFWNKGDALQSRIAPSKAYRRLADKLGSIQDVFRTTREDPATTASGITAIRIKEKAYLFPNDLRVSLRYDNGEYLLLTFRSIDKLDALKPPAYDPTHFKERIAAQVSRSDEGHAYIKGIPMIDQGDKGYCAAATLARVLQYYGYSVDQHAMAALAETEAKLTENARGGTLRDNIIKAMRRICGSTPFRLRELDKERPEAIMPIIEQGIPIIWFIPGHARLLIGLHPENNQIVYSDSWGPEHAYKTQSWDYYVNMNQEMWILTPR